MFFKNFHKKKFEEIICADSTINKLLCEFNKELSAILGRPNLGKQSYDALRHLRMRFDSIFKDIKSDSPETYEEFLSTKNAHYVLGLLREELRQIQERKK